MTLFLTFIVTTLVTVFMIRLSIALQLVLLSLGIYNEAYFLIFIFLFKLPISNQYLS